MITFLFHYNDEDTIAQRGDKVKGVYVDSCRSTEGGGRVAFR